MKASRWVPSTFRASSRQFSSRYSDLRSSVLPEKAVRLLASGCGAFVSKREPVMSEGFNQRLEEPAFRAVFVRFGSAVAPDGSRPVGITLISRDNVNMQLTDNITEGPDIDLSGAGRLLQSCGHRIGLEGQKRLVERCEFEDLADAFALRDKHKPGPSTVLHQAKLAQAENRHHLRIALQPLVQRELPQVAFLRRH
ncbi:protein of unknown function [Pseudorhizobium banfieldiae]|uniref:Uncharacterized protein n=1 Tax=Pseudorhizobium banfieldiae TaxID=1125847 RepID=L0NKZ9_9HYPH|nr:protein of unknown function [Pseudorhizobium banfieldiae]